MGATCHAGQIKNALGNDFSALDLGNGHELTARSDLYQAVDDGGVAPSHENGLTPLEPRRVRRANGQRRDVVQRGLDRQ